jgi:hypothetical protein
MQALGLALLLSVSMPGSAAVRQSGAQPAKSAQGEKVNPRTIPVPEGYLDAMAAGSPAIEFLEDLRVDWEKRGFEPRGLVSVLVKASDLEAYYSGGPNPLEGHYAYVSFLESANVLQDMSNIRAQIGAIFDQGSFDAGQAIRKMKPGQSAQLGILKDWETGFIFGYVVGLEDPGRNKSAKMARLLLTAVVARPGGGYFVNDVSVMADGSDLHASLARVEALARQIEIPKTPSGEGK